MGIEEKYVPNPIIIKNMLLAPAEKYLIHFAIPRREKCRGFHIKEKKAKNFDSLRPFFLSTL